MTIELLHLNSFQSNTFLLKINSIVTVVAVAVVVSLNNGGNKIVSISIGYEY